MTLAAMLLFGRDTAIMSALPQHKTDMIFRVHNMDRYDDRDVIITNLLDSYDRMGEFAKKHLNDPFVLDGMQSCGRLYPTVWHAAIIPVAMWQKW